MLGYFYKSPQNPADVQSIVDRFDFLIFSMGDENGLKIARAAGKKVLQYVRSDAIQDAGSAQPRHNQVAFQKGDFATLKKKHPDWFLRDKSGNMILANANEQPNYYLMDWGNPDWQQWFNGRVKLMRQSGDWSGTFFDNLEASFAKRIQCPPVPVKYPDDATYIAAVKSFLTYQRKNLTGLLYANIINRRTTDTWMDYLELLDGGFDESWGVGWRDLYVKPDQWESDLDLVNRSRSASKGVMLVSQGSQIDKSRQCFAYASFLLVSDDGAAFRYASADSYGSAWWYDTYDQELGEALTDVMMDGDNFIRVFERGYVMVNPVTHDARIFTA